MEHKPETKNKKQAKKGWWARFLDWVAKGQNASLKAGCKT